MKRMLSEHLKNERLHRVNQGWKYLTTWQKAAILIRALWWAKPTWNDILLRLQKRLHVWLDYRLYDAHWVNYE
jgi:hypothetical protein